MTKDPGFDHGLLSPSTVGRAIETATGDEAVLQAMLDAQAALVRAQARLGVVPRVHADTITTLADARRLDLGTIARRATATADPVVALIAELTAVVAEVDTAAAEFVHRGATGQDILDTGLILVAERALRIIDADLAATADALAALADRHRATPVPGHPPTRYAAVSATFGLTAAIWLSGVLDARRRVHALLAGGLPVQLGGAAGYLASARPEGVSERGLPARLVGAFAAELSLAEPTVPWHTVRTPLHETASAASLTTVLLGTMAADVQVMARPEVGEPVEPERDDTTPRRRNPVLVTRIRAAAAQVPLLAASVAGCLVAEAGPPAGAWYAEWQPLRAALRLTGGAADAAAELAQGLVVFADRMRGEPDLVAAGCPAAPLRSARDADAADLLVDRVLYRHQTFGRDAGPTVRSTGP